MRIVSVVEGHGEVESVPALVRRIGWSLDPPLHADAPPGIRVPKSRLIRPGELERVVILARKQVGGRGGVLIVLDADDDCPADMGPSLRERAVGPAGGLPVGVVVAKVEFEAWFLAAASSLAGKRGLAADLTSPGDPENVHDAKGWLKRHRIAAKGYSETLDQPAFTNLFDLDAARAAPSFDKCYRDVCRLLRHASSTPRA